MKKLAIVSMFTPLFLNAMQGARFSCSLVDLAEAGSLIGVKERLAAGEDINQLDGDGSTALYGACQFNHKDVALYLLEQGADPTIFQSPTVAAPIRELALLLLDPETDQNASEFSTSTPLHYAINYGTLPVCEAILKRICAIHMPCFSQDSYKRVLAALCVFKRYGEFPVEVRRAIWGIIPELGWDVLCILFGSDQKEPIEHKMHRAIEVLGSSTSAELLSRNVMKELRAFLLLKGDMDHLRPYEYAVECCKDVSDAHHPCKEIVQLLNPDSLNERLPELILKWFALQDE